MADEIKYNDLVAPGTFEKIISDGEKLISTFVELEKVVKGSMSGLKAGLTGNITSAADVEKTQALVQQVSNLEQELIKTKKAKEALTVETAKAKIQQQEFDKSVKQTAKDELGLTSEYAKQSRVLNEMRHKYKDMALAQNANTKEAKALLDNITKLDAKIKQVDATVGQHQRNVGNYTGTLTEMKNGLLQIGGALGIAFGVTEVIDFGKESIKAFVEAEKNAHDLEFAIRNIGGENGSALDKLLKQSGELQENSIFSDDDIQKAQTALVQYGLTTDQVEKLVPHILDLATAQGEDLATATDKVIKGINGQTKGLKTAGIAFEDTGSKTENLAILTDKLAKFQGAAASALETTEGKAQRLTNAFDDFKETVGDFLVNTGADAMDFFNEIGKRGLFGAFDENAFKGLTEAYAKKYEDFNNMALELATKGEEQKKVAIAQVEKQIAIILDQASKTTDTNQRLTLAKLANHERLVLEEIRNTKKERTKILDDETKQDDSKAKDDLARQKKLYEEQLALEKFIADEKEKARKKERSLDVANWKEAVADAEKMYDDMLQAELDAWDNAKKIKEEKDRQALEDKKRRAEEVADSIETVEQLMDVYKGYYDKINELKRESIENDLDSANRNIEIQAQLAARGLENTLAYEMEKKNELEKARTEQLEREKKQAKQQEAAELGLAFIKAYQNYIGKNMNSGQALSKAATDVLAAKLLSKAIAGAFAEGVENFNGEGTGTSDSNLIAFSNGESVVTAKGTQETAGLVTAVNKKGKQGAVEWAMDNVYLPNYKANGLSDVSTKQQTETALVSVLVSELNDLKTVIKNKKETDIKYDTFGNLIKIEVENGVRKVTTKKRYLS